MAARENQGLQIALITGRGLVPFRGLAELCRGLLGALHHVQQLVLERALPPAERDDLVLQALQLLCRKSAGL